MPYSLDDILYLVGRLDDSPGDNPPRERFREFLPEHIENVGHARDMIESCLQESGKQYSRALQDLVNFTGNYLGFEVEYGRYQGVAGESGHDGLWISPSEFYVVIETKTSETYNIKTATLTGYIDKLVSEGTIESRENAMGLYVIGKPDPTSQLEDAIVVQNKTDELRTISTDALLSLAGLLSKYDVTHEDALAVLRPSGPSIDPIANLMARIMEEEQKETRDVGGNVEMPVEQGEAKEAEPPSVNEEKRATETELSYWMTPVSDKGGMTPEQVIHRLVGEEQIYGYRGSTPGRKDLSQGDRIAFYASGEGIVAHAEVASEPDEKAKPSEHLPVPESEDFPYVFELRRPTLYLEEPVGVKNLRSQLEAFKGRDLSKSWSWFVQQTKEISEHDFDVLTR